MRGKLDGVRLAVLPSVLAILALLCPPHAIAKRATGGPPAAGLFGTNLYETPTAEELHRMAIGGLSSIRLIFWPGFVEPSPGPRNWRDYDRLVTDAARQGISVDPILFGVPPWINQNASALPLQSPGQEQYWFGFVREAARRYGPGGVFWAQNPGVPPRPMRNWEVWNEPNLNAFVGQTTPLKARDYGRLLAITRSALQEASPANRVVIGGLYRRPKPGTGTGMTRFLQRLYKLRHGRALFDAVAIHPYAARPLQVIHIAQSVRRLMDANDDPRTPIWITEVGWTTGGDYWAQSPYRATPAQQAVRVGRTTRLMLGHRRQLRLKRFDWMIWRDRGGDGRFWSLFMGLFTADGHPKPAWAAFTQVTGGVTGGTIQNVGPPQPGPSAPPPGGGSRPPSPSCLLPGILC